MDKEQAEQHQSNAQAIVKAAVALFDNRMGHGYTDRLPCAPRELWADLGACLYGEEDPRVKELRGSLEHEPTTGRLRDELKPMHGTKS